MKIIISIIYKIIGKSFFNFGKINTNIMKIGKFLLIVVAASMALSSCVESSAKYKALQAQLDSLGISAAAKSAEYDEVFATLNEVENGLKSIREAENIITIQSQGSGLEVQANTREQLKSDVDAIAEAIKGYKSQIDKLKRDSKVKSNEFKKRLAAISAELDNKNVLITELQNQLAEKESVIKIKTQQITSLGETVNTLKQDVSNLYNESKSQKETISTQDQQINTGYYIVGSKEELIAANVMSKGGLFKSAKISYNAEQSAFTKIDIRKISEINLNSKKAKVLSIHASNTYTIISDPSGIQILKIEKPLEFWEQTKYLVIQIQ